MERKEDKKGEREKEQVWGIVVKRKIPDHARNKCQSHNPQPVTKLTEPSWLIIISLNIFLKHWEFSEG